MIEMRFGNTAHGCAAAAVCTDKLIGNCTGEHIPLIHRTPEIDLFHNSNQQFVQTRKSRYFIFCGMVMICLAALTSGPLSRVQPQLRARSHRRRTVFSRKEFYPHGDFHIRNDATFGDLGDQIVSLRGLQNSAYYQSSRKQVLPEDSYENEHGKEVHKSHAGVLATLTEWMHGVFQSIHRPSVKSKVG